MEPLTMTTTQSRLKPDSLLASPTYQYGSVSSVHLSSDGLDSSAAPRPAQDPRLSRLASMFGLAAVVGTLLWISIYTLERATVDPTTYESIYDNYGKPVTPPSLLDSLHIPLLGSSNSYKAQAEANRNRRFLYVKPHYHTKKHHKHNAFRLVGATAEGNNEVEASVGCDATVMLMRHCEKGDIREHCDLMGYERSVYLASQFGDHKDARWPAPSYLFAEMPGMRRNPEKRNFRELETILPLADKFNLTVDTSYSTLDTKDMAKRIQGMMRTGELCGKLVVISWKHSKLPRVAGALGCGPEDGCPLKYHGSNFDELWQVKFVYHKQLHSNHKDLREPKRRQWLVFGSVQKEGFDPLAFSKKMGDYPKGGTRAGGRWMDYDHEIPERDSLDDDGLDDDELDIVM